MVLGIRQLSGNPHSNSNMLIRHIRTVTKLPGYFRKSFCEMRWLHMYRISDTHTHTHSLAINQFWLSLHSYSYTISVRLYVRLTSRAKHIAQVATKPQMAMLWSIAAAVEKFINNNYCHIQTYIRIHTRWRREWWWRCVMPVIAHINFPERKLWARLLKRKHKPRPVI